MTDDITKHKDWQKWQGALTEQCYYGSSDRQILEALAPLIFAAGQADAQAELTAARARIAEQEAAREGFKQIIDGIEDDQRAPICERDHGYMEAIADVRTSLEAIGSP